MSDVKSEVVEINVPSVIINPSNGVAKREGPITVTLKIYDPERNVNPFAQVNRQSVAEKPTTEEVALEIGLVVTAAIQKRTEHQLKTVQQLQEDGKILEQCTPEEREKLLNPQDAS